MNEEHPITWTDERIERLWNYYSRSAAVKDQYFARVYGGYVLRRTRLRAITSLRVLDFGCGTGGLWEKMKRAGVRWRYTGLDFSRDSIENLNQRFGTDIGFDGAVYVKELPSALCDSSFDAAFLLEVVEHLADERLQATLTEVARLLRPGGHLFVSTLNDEDLERESKYCPECGAVFHQWQHVRNWTPSSLRKTIAEHGFEHKRTWCGHWDDHWLGGWIFNRAARYWRGRRTDPHMFLTFVKPELDC